MNAFTEVDALHVLSACIKHPFIEIVQLADLGQSGLARESEKRISRHANFSANREKFMDMMEKKLRANQSLKQLEIRFFCLPRDAIKAIFKGLETNKTLQKLILTHDSLLMAEADEIIDLRNSLRTNQRIR